MFWTVSEGIRDLCDAMVSSPSDWVQGRYEFTNIVHPDISIWNCNGTGFIKISGNNCLTLFEKIAIRRAINKTIARKLSSKEAK